MEYKRPNDVKLAHPDELAKIKDRLKSELGLIEKLLEGQIESVCHLCESFGYGYEDAPQGWGWLKGYPALLCNNCINRWTERFGAPEVQREGELNEHGTISEILHIGDRQIEDLFDGEVEITEKVDGSQLGFGKINGRLFVRSKGRELDLDNPDGMFIDAVEFVKTIEDRIPDNYTFYGEYLQKPKHNTLAYDRIPANHIALFGVYDYTRKEFHNYDSISEWAGILGVDAIPLIKKGQSSPEEVLELVQNRVSYLGGQNIEGVVVKAYKPWLFLGTIPLGVMSGKYVTEAFKEVHIKTWKAENTGKGRLEVAVSQYKSEARWNKAIQHLRDDGSLTASPKDIGALIKEIKQDVVTEEKEAIKAQLWAIYGEQFTRAATEGFPQWYKEKLVLGEIHDGKETSNQEHEAQDSEGEADSTSDR